LKSTPFNPNSDLAPIPFSKEVCMAAKSLKEKGLDWNPHVGCFVWDENNSFEVTSPFPNQIYFILNLGHFLKIFDTVENMKDKLVWIPTFHQAKSIIQKFNLSDEKKYSLNLNSVDTLEEELIKLYQIIFEHL
jgi:hypothetical protein